MRYKTIDVEVEVDLDEWTDKELIQEMEHRGYTVSKGLDQSFRQEDYDFLIGVIDKMPFNYYSEEVRSKLINARYN